MKNILIIGATSAIAEAVARIYAQRGDRLYLLGRNRERLDTLARDLRIHGADSVSFSTLDVTNHESHQTVLAQAAEDLGGMDTAILAHGTLPDQKACEKNFEITLQELDTNLIGAISVLTHLANFFAVQEHGTIAVISSVAGDRGRQSNYVYGAAKGGLTVFLQGLRNRLFAKNVHVITIKPGFVDTPMTANFEKGLLWAKPEKVAKDIVKGIDAKRNNLYTPKFWRLIMLVIKAIPESMFKRLRL